MNTLEKQLEHFKQNFEQISLDSYDSLSTVKQALTRLGGAYRALGKWNDALHTFDIGLELCRKAGNEEGIAEYYIWKSNVCYHSGFYGRAIEFATKALNYDMSELSRAGRMSYFLAKPYLLLGDIQKYIDLQHEAIKLIQPLDKDLYESDLPWFLSDL